MYGRDVDNRFPLPGEYVDAIRRAGGVAVLLPPGQANPSDWLERVDGLLLAGGGDVDPQHYQGQAHETIYNLDAERDTTELALARMIVETGFPSLCICRGMQVLNVALGGTLHEHLPDAVGETINHRLPPREPTPHPISVKPESKLAGILGETEFRAASWHHQALRDVAPELRVSAVAPDGTVEAVEMPEHPWLIAVQWHPEITAHTSPIQQRLFDAFVQTAAARTPQ
jgi:putative glutamine amidotransferase